MAFVLLAAFIVIGLLFALTSGSDVTSNEVKIPEGHSSYTRPTKRNRGTIFGGFVDDVPSISSATSTGDDLSPELLSFDSGSGLSDITMD